MRPLARLMARRASAPAEPGIPVPEVAAAAAPGRAEAVDAIEADVLGALARVVGAVEVADGEVGVAREDLARIVAHAAGIVDAARGAAERAADVVASTGRVAAAAATITDAADAAGRRVDEAVAEAAEAGERIAALARASDEILGIVDAIAAVARQTNLLALNATIEAARAGAAGRGFAVVAAEVKALSVETGRAADDVRARIGRLRASAAASVAAVEGVAAVVGEVRPAVATVRAAAGEQGAAIADLTRGAGETHAFVDAVSGRAGRVDEAAREAGRRIEGAAAAVADAAAIADGLGRRFVVALRQDALGDRRVHERYPVELTVRGPGLRGARTIDVGAGGLLVGPVPDPAPAVGSALSLDVERIGPVAVRVVAVSPLGAHCAFAADGAGRAAALIEDLRAEHAPLVAVAQAAAGRVAAALERACAAGLLAPETLFPTGYRPIPGTDPVQFTVPGLDVLEELLPPILEPLLISDNRMVFCIAADRNGYVPVHNRRVSQPQRPGETAWNTANSRNRRVFDDRAGLTAARATRPFTVQAYPRDMGGGATVTLREVDAPIWVLGRHWGGFRTAYRL